MDAVADVFKGIAERTDAAIALAHHIRKPVAGQNEATAADARGASALINKVRLSRVFNVMTPQLAINARILEDQRSSYFRVDSGKRNIAPAEKATWYKIIPVTCANGQDTPTVVPWTYPNVFDQVTIDHVTRIRTIAAEGAYRKDPRSKEGPWIGEAVADMLDLDLNDETDRKQLNKILKTWFNNGVLATEERPDDQRKKRKFVVPGPSWNDADAGSATIIPFPTASPITSAEQDAFGPSDKGTSAAPTTAAMPFMLTAAHKRELRALGYTDEEIREMTPQKGHDILAQRRLSERHCKLADVLTAWFATIGVAQPRTIEQVIAAANGGDDDAQRKLRLALMAVAPKDNRADGIDSTRLEKWLRSISGTEVEHLTLRSRGLDENKVLQWALELRVEPDKGSPSL
jgi:hypothetical protein